MIRAGYGRRAPARDVRRRSGPAGMTLAMELARRGRPSLVLESGSTGRARRRTFRAPRSSIPPATTTCASPTARRLGGTSNLWGGRSMPLDPVDFVAAALRRRVRWPIGYDDVAPYYATACRYVDCGETVFTLAAPELSAANDDFEFDRIERASNRPWFQKAHAATPRRLAADRHSPRRDRGRDRIRRERPRDRRRRRDRRRAATAPGGGTHRARCWRARIDATAAGCATPPTRRYSAARMARSAATTWAMSSARSPTWSLTTRASTPRSTSCATGAARSCAVALRRVP